LLLIKICLIKYAQSISTNRYKSKPDKFSKKLWENSGVLKYKNKSRFWGRWILVGRIENIIKE
jgi:hypothetical protein